MSLTALLHASVVQNAASSQLRAHSITAKAFEAPTGKSRFSLELTRSACSIIRDKTGIHHRAFRVSI
jgi:hypothetical protein